MNIGIFNENRTGHVATSEFFKSARVLNFNVQNSFFLFIYFWSNCRVAKVDFVLYFESILLRIQVSNLP